MTSQEQEKARKISAHVLHSNASILGAPEYVLSALRTWLRELDAPQSGVHKDGAGVSDFAAVELVDVRRKNDA